jgi:hypothetical protein
LVVKISAEVNAQAPHGQLVFDTLDLAPLLASAGHRVKAVEYLLGNHARRPRRTCWALRPMRELRIRSGPLIQRFAGADDSGAGLNRQMTGVSLALRGSA